jgi:hypothetical protein
MDFVEHCCLRPNIKEEVQWQVFLLVLLSLNVFLVFCLFLSPVLPKDGLQTKVCLLLLCPSVRMAFLEPHCPYTSPSSFLSEPSKRKAQPASA